MLVEVTDPFLIFLVSLLAFDGFGVLGMSEANNKAFLFKHVVDRNPIFTGGFHTDFRTVMRRKPVAKTIEIAVKRIESFLDVLSDQSGTIGDTDRSHKDILVYIHAAAYKTLNLIDRHDMFSFLQRKALNAI